MTTAKKKLFKINWDDVVKTKGGNQYVTTTPPHPHGEVRKDRDKRYVYLHRAIKELQLGRYLKPGEDVHHKDENPLNNALSNLELTSHADHQKTHAEKKKFWKKSPMNKPKHKKKAALRVVQAFLNCSDIS